MPINRAVKWHLTELVMPLLGHKPDATPLLGSELGREGVGQGHSLRTIPGYKLLARQYAVKPAVPVMLRIEFMKPTPNLRRVIRRCSDRQM
jgi:hypothetical protein